MKTPLKARPRDEPGLARGSRSGRFQPGPSSNARTRQNSTVPPSQRWTEGVPRRKVNSQHPSVSFLLEGGCNSKFCLLVLQRPPQGPTSKQTEPRLRWLARMGTLGCPHVGNLGRVPVLPKPIRLSVTHLHTSLENGKQGASSARRFSKLHSF